jgi:hypothetical protein
MAQIKRLKEMVNWPSQKHLQGIAIFDFDVQHTMSEQEIGLEQGTATFHKIRAPSSLWQKRALFYWSL